MRRKKKRREKKMLLIDFLSFSGRKLCWSDVSGYRNISVFECRIVINWELFFKLFWNKMKSQSIRCIKRKKINGERVFVWSGMRNQFGGIRIHFRSITHSKKKNPVNLLFTWPDSFEWIWVVYFSSTSIYTWKSRLDEITLRISYCCFHMHWKQIIQSVRID